MAPTPMSKILMAVSDVAAVRRLNHSHLNAEIAVAGSRRQFLEGLERQSNVVVLAEPGLPDIGFAEMMDRAMAENSHPVIVVIDGETNMSAQKDIRVANISDLPSVVRTGIKDTEERSGLRAARSPDSSQVAEFLRKNHKMISLGQLAATIAHEINNPLESLTNLLYLLEQDRGLNERSRGFLEIAQRELDRTAQICRQTLRFSRDTSEPVPVRMGELVDEVLVLFGRKIAGRKIAVTRQFGRMDTIVAFPGEMRQIITNLVSNAIEASAEGGKIIVRIRSSVGRHGRGLRLSVADNGPGIPREVISRLGEPFFTTKGQSGTGLGLSVTKTIIDSRGGKLSIYSSMAKKTHGSVFSVFLPASSQPRTDRERSSRNNLQLVPRGGHRLHGN